MMHYEDSAFQEIKLSYPESEMLDQDYEPTPEEGDEYIGMEVLLTRVDGYQNATVVNRKRDIYGELVVLHNTNPILDTRVYESM